MKFLIIKKRGSKEETEKKKEVATIFKKEEFKAKKGNKAPGIEK